MRDDGTTKHQRTTDPMPEENVPLNERQRRFCVGLLSGLPATKAYKAAGYSTKSERSVESSSSTLLRNAKVAAYLGEHRKAGEKDAIITRRELSLIRAKIVRDPETPNMVKLRAMRDEEKARGWDSPQVIEVRGSLIDQIRGHS